MKSKVILFCVLLFCSKFVESIPYSEEQTIQRAYQPSIWPESQNAPRKHPNNFARTQNLNSARQNDNTQEYFQNQGRLNDESYGYENNPTFITPEKEAFDDYSSADGQRLNSYPTRVDYTHRVDAPQFENNNWPSQNQYINSAEKVGNTAIKEQPLVTTVRNPYQGPGQYQLPKLTSSSKRQHYEDEGYEQREQYYQETGPSSSIPFVKNNDAAVITNNAKNIKFGGPRYVERSQSGNKNGAPAVIGDVLTNPFENKKHVDISDIDFPMAKKIENIRLVISDSDQVPINTVNINNKDHSLRMVDAVVAKSEVEKTNRRYNNMNNYRSRPVPINKLSTRPINNYNVALPDVENINVDNYNYGQSDVTLVDKSRINRFGPNYALQSKPVKNVYWNNNDGPADEIDTVLEKSKNSKYYVNGHGSNAGSKELPTVTDYNTKNDAPLIDVLAEKTGKKRFIDNSESHFEPPKPVPTNKNIETPGTLIDAVTINPNHYKSSHSFNPRHGPRNPEPIDRNTDHNNQHHKKIQSFSVKDLVSKAHFQNILSGNSKRFVIVHPNNTVEYKDKLDFPTEDNKKYRFLNADQFHEGYGVSNGNGTYSTQPTANVPASSQSTAPPVSADGPTLPPVFKEPESNNKSRPLVPSKSDDHPSVSTLAPTVPYNNTTPIPLLLTIQDDKNDQQVTTYSPAITTTAHPDNSSEIITISPIELATDNVTDVPSVTTTTESPLTSTVTLDTVTYASIKQDDANNGTNLTSSVASTLASTEKLSTTTVSPSNSVSVTKDEGSGIVIEIMTKANGTQNNETIIIDQGNNKKNGTQTAMNSSLTNSDVPTKRDDNSPVTTVLSIQNDINTGETSTTDDNTLEYKQSETDIIITLSTSNDSEDESITMSIEVSESTDDEDSSNKDVVLVQIPTKKDNKVDSKTLNTDACEKDCNNESNNDTNTGKNVEIDLKNINGEPIMWVKTTNEDIMQKLISKNDTSYDVIYFFNVQNKTIVEKDKHTTIFCNGTVVIDQTETTWQYENDPSPKVEKTSKTIDIKDYKP